MQAWKINKAKNMVLENVEQEPDLKTEAKIKISRATISSSDISTYLGKNSVYPITPSRSALGFISESNNPSFLKGQRVFLSPYAKNKSDYKLKSIKEDGYLSDFAIAAFPNIYTLPDGISDKAVTFIEDIALAIKTIEKLKIKKTQYVLLIGVSSFNLILAQLCLYYQAIPVIVDNDNDLLQLADDLGVYYAINSKDQELNATLNEITSGHYADHIIFNTDAFTEISESILNLIAVDGTAAICGTNKIIDSYKLDLSPVIEKGLKIYGISDGFGAIEASINMLATGIVKVDNIECDEFEFNTVNEIFEDLTPKRLRFKTLVKC